MVRPLLLATMVATAVPAWGCGGSGDTPDELPAAFTVMATRETTVTDPCTAPDGNDQDFTIVDADTDAPELRTSGLAVRFCAYGSADTGWLIECNTADPATVSAPWTFTINAAQDGGRVTWREFTGPDDGSPICDDAFTIDDIIAVQ